jgi:maleate cis-trans isomerase
VNTMTNISGSLCNERAGYSQGRVPFKTVMTHRNLSSSLLSKNMNIKIYRTVIVRVVLYGCETWSLTLREERRLRVF